MSAARHLTVAPTAAQALRQEITDICVQIDQHLGNRAGTAERGIYFWYSESLADIDVLTRLRADALNHLHNLTNSPKETSQHEHTPPRAHPRSQSERHRQS